MDVAVDGKRCVLEPRQRSKLLTAGFKTHIGFGRSANEDTGWIALDRFPLDRAGHLMAVADGLGGHQGGGYASQYVCNALRMYYNKLSQTNRFVTAADLRRHLTDLIFQIDLNLRFEAMKYEFLKDMGTTLSCLILTATHSIIGHVGDSRIYRWRRGRLTCLTVDHTFVQEMIEIGEIDPRTADSHPLRHLLTQTVGTVEPLEHVYTRIDAVRPGDRFLLCTDGLHNSVSNDKIGDILAMDGDADHLAGHLLQTALGNRTKDNVTILVVTVGGAKNIQGRDEAAYGC